MVRRRSVRRGRSLRRKLVCRRRSLRHFDRVGASRRTSRFGAEEQNLAIAIARIIAQHPPALNAFVEFVRTTVLEKCGIEGEGAIDKNCQELKALQEFLKRDSMGPVPKPTKFGVDPLNMPAVKKAAKKILAALRKEAVEADAAAEAAEAAYYEKRCEMDPKVVYTTYRYEK